MKMEIKITVAAEKVSDAIYLLEDYIDTLEVKPVRSQERVITPGTKTAPNSQWKLRNRRATEKILSPGTKAMNAYRILEEHPSHPDKWTYELIGKILEDSLGDSLKAAQARYYLATKGVLVPA